MTDLTPSPDATRTCAVCGAQNDPSDPTCTRCGAPLPASSGEGDEQRGDLELEEVWRAAAVGGFDADLDVDPAGVGTCPVCGEPIDLGEDDLVGRQPVRDSATPRPGLAVVTLRCPRCRSGLRAVRAGDGGAQVEPGPDRREDGTWTGEPGATAPDGRAPEATGDVVQDRRNRSRQGRAAVAAAGTDEGEGRSDEVPWRSPPRPGASPEEPLGDERRLFADTEPADTLRELRDGEVLDADGDDIRQYTGEPVETEEGWVLPQQQNVGPGNEAGGGEWPDPASPAAQPKEGSPAAQPGPDTPGGPPPVAQRRVAADRTESADQR